MPRGLVGVVVLEAGSHMLRATAGFAATPTSLWQGGLDGRAGWSQVARTGRPLKECFANPGAKVAAISVFTVYTLTLRYKTVTQCSSLWRNFLRNWESH